MVVGNPCVPVWALYWVAAVKGRCFLVRATGEYGSSLNWRSCLQRKLGNAGDSIYSVATSIDERVWRKSILPALSAVFAEESGGS